MGSLIHQSPVIPYSSPLHSMMLPIGPCQVLDLQLIWKLVKAKEWKMLSSRESCQHDREADQR